MGIRTGEAVYDAHAEGVGIELGEAIGSALTIALAGDIHATTASVDESLVRISLGAMRAVANLQRAWLDERLEAVVAVSETEVSVSVRRVQ